MSDFTSLSSADLAALAAPHSTRLPPKHPARLRVNELDWRFDRLFPVKQLAEDEEQGKRRYHELAATQEDWGAFEAWWRGANDSVMVVVLIDGKAHIWDGQKRAAICRKDDTFTVRAIVGSVPRWDRPRLLSQDGKLYVVTRDLLDDRPMIQELWWPTGMSTYNVVCNHGSDLLGAALDGVSGDAGSYQFWLPTWHKPMTIRLAEGSSTRSTISRFINVPEPKVRRGTTIAWMRGGWRKLSTREGWVPV